MGRPFGAPLGGFPVGRLPFGGGPLGLFLSGAFAFLTSDLGGVGGGGGAFFGWGFSLGCLGFGNFFLRFAASSKSSFSTALAICFLISASEDCLAFFGGAGGGGGALPLGGGGGGGTLPLGGGGGGGALPLGGGGGGGALPLGGGGGGGGALSAITIPT